jgi:hypothetical protein
MFSVVLSKGGVEMEEKNLCAVNMLWKALATATFGG